MLLEQYKLADGRVLFRDAASPHWDVWRPPVRTTIRLTHERVAYYPTLEQQYEAQQWQPTRA